MKRIILILLIFVALISCEKESTPKFYMVNIQTNGSFIVVDYHQDYIELTDSCNLEAVNYQIRYTPNKTCYLHIRSNDSLLITITHGRDTAIIKQGLNNVFIQEWE